MTDDIETMGTDAECCDVIDARNRFVQRSVRQHIPPAPVVPDEGELEIYKCYGMMEQYWRMMKAAARTDYERNIIDCLYRMYDVGVAYEWRLSLGLPTEGDENV